ncbi:MAG TPA: ComF family protein [Terracidiphilus sp.]|nr:ComF family protein [Terracidiphilus sp.]
MLRSPLDAIGSTLLPAPCALCGSPLPQLSSAPICDACWTEIPIHGGPVCERCGDSLDQPPVEGIASSQCCRACRLAPPSFVRAVSFGTYEGRMRSAIHALKYDRIHPAARRLGSMLAAAIAQLSLDVPDGLLVVPVPLHRTKHRERGFNQARALAKSAIDALHKSHPGWHLTLAPATLMRLRSTESQAGLTPRQRRQNVRGAFKVSDPSAVQGNNILLVDDILTTGATARAAAQSLVRAGAASVYVATLARARRIHFNQSVPFDTRRAQPGIPTAADSQFAGLHSSSSSTHQPFSRGE